jgi:YVTN family beta-propeller protein
MHRTDAILPDGRIAAPVGQSIFVGTNPLGMAISPDGHYIIVSNDDDRTGGLSIPAPPLAIGYSLAVVDAQRMNVASVYSDPSTTFFMGVAAVRDPRNPGNTIVLASDGRNGVVRVFDLGSGGQLTPEAETIALPAGSARPFPAGITVAPNGSTAYVVDNLNDAVVVIDLASRTVVRSIPVGDFPFDVAVGGGHVLVSGGGLEAYAALNPPALTPQFASPVFDPERSSSLAVLDVAANGDFAGDPSTVHMDQAPDGTSTIGGASPGAVVISPNGQLAYVALANVDRVAVVALRGEPRVARGLDMRLFPNAPYGAQPSAEALSRDGKRLYVALAGLNAVAVLDARSATRYRYGLIPTAWLPGALALSPNGRYLYIANAKGVDGWGILQRVDLKHLRLIKATLDTLRYNRTPAPAKFNAVIPPLRSNRRSTAIDHVVYVAVGTQTFDAMLGDLKDASGAQHGNGNPQYSTYPESVTPNLHALARAYALADNFYAGDEDLDVSRGMALAGQATLFAEFTGEVTASRVGMNGEQPEDYGRSGYLFNALSRAGLTFRDYGGLLGLSGYSGMLYHENVPALAVLSDHADLNYPGRDVQTDDGARAKEFIADMQRYVSADQMPNFTYLWLPVGNSVAGVAAADRALGEVTDFITHTPHWSSTAIFIVPEGAADGTDHVNALRTYALVVSPLARRGYVGSWHLSVPSVVKTEEEIFGLPPLTLGDLLATDMADFFTQSPDPSPYNAIGGSTSAAL